MSALTLHKLSVAFGGGVLSGPRHIAVRQVSLTLPYGQVTALIGESGSGKTSLVRTALGLAPMTSGKVELLGHDLAGLSSRQLLALRRRVQLIFQDPHSMLNPGLSVRAHLMESATLHQPQREPEHLIAKVARQVGLEHRLLASPRELSGGERRRVGVARVLIADPVLLVADEPTAGLDAALRADLVDLILAGHGPDRATLIVSHDLPLVRYASDRVLVMLQGEIVDRFETLQMGLIPHHPYTTQLLRDAGLMPPGSPS